MRVRPLVAVLASAMVMAIVMALTGCTGSDPTGSPESPPSPFQACPAAASAPPAHGDGSVGQPLPAITLDCFTGGQPVVLGALGRPAVINLWASWCGPCRDELPELQAFADELGDRAVVLGVVTNDQWDKAAYAGADFGITFPSVFDPERRLQLALGRIGIPLTVFVDAAGTVRHIDMSGSLTLPELRDLAAEHLSIRA